MAPSPHALPDHAGLHGSMRFLPTSYDVWGVLASVLIASVASYVTLDLARRVRQPDRLAALLWWLGGSLVMGTGIWSMHFVGMLAFSLPIQLGYTPGLTAASFVAAVFTSGVALGIASLGRLGLVRVLVGAGVMGLGICAMHYTGMAALDMAPGIVWNMGWVAASTAIAVGASAVALWLFFWLRGFQGLRGWVYQIVAAAVMGLAISGMHYAGMAAASFPQDAVCLSVDALGGRGLAIAVGVACVLLLLLTLAVSSWDYRMQRRTATLSSSLRAANAELQSANDELHRRAFSDPLTGLPNRLLFEDRLAHALSRHDRADESISQRKAERIGVLFIDLDGFKPVNDIFGHAAGDAVLKAAAGRLQELARSSDTVARVGGDEFLLLAEDAGSVADCMTLGGRVAQALSQPFEVAGRSVQIGC